MPSKKKLFSKHKNGNSKSMMFIFIAWLLTLLTFAILLRAIHTIPIYAYTELESQSQKLQLKTVFSMAAILFSLALTLLLLHFTLPNPVENPPIKSSTQISVHDMNLSIPMDAYNLSL
jgi:signal transduction histidine kinase